MIRFFLYLPENEPTLKLVKSLKPHTSKITGLLFSPNGETFVSSSDDSTIFFFHANEYSPIGFIRLSSSAVSMDWSTNSRSLLVACKGGSLFECSTPINDTDQMELKTFELLGVPMRQLYFKREDKTPPPTSTKETDTASNNHTTTNASPEAPPLQPSPSTTAVATSSTQAEGSTVPTTTATTAPSNTNNASNTTPVPVESQDLPPLLAEGKPVRILVPFEKENCFYLTLDGRDSGICELMITILKCE